LNEGDVLLDLQFRLKCLGAAKGWSRSFRISLENLGNQIKPEDVMCKPTLMLKEFIVSCKWPKDFDFTQCSLAEVAPEDYNQTLQSLVPHRHFLILPLASSPSFEKITGTTGEAKKDWRLDPNKDIRRITRTLDAFTHFVFEKSGGQNTKTALASFCQGRRD
jgi:hypothetical protein